MRSKFKKKRYDRLKIYMLKFILKRERIQSADFLSLPSSLCVDMDGMMEEGSHLQAKKKALTRS